MHGYGQPAANGPTPVPTCGQLPDGPGAGESGAGLPARRARSRLRAHSVPENWDVPGDGRPNGSVPVPVGRGLVLTPCRAVVVSGEAGFRGGIAGRA
ncbi:hypothetical protein GCM10009544_16690 [Streptomyces stramineus]|uniref:Uncharacterized protein n=1 Tax=Streptomyces stramineus TaxID=173861 RepID=A0ABN0ZPI4_9ACTN